jgi:hypothetical protein
MSVRDGWKKLADTVKGITLPSSLDTRPHRLVIRTRTWSGEVIGSGSYTDSDLVLPQKYRIRGITSHDIISSGGRFQMGDVKVSGITQQTSDGTVGYTADQLLPNVAAPNVEVIYILIGNDDGEYDLISLEGYKILSWEMVLRRKTGDRSRGARIRTIGATSVTVDSA